MTKETIDQEKIYPIESETLTEENVLQIVMEYINKNDFNIVYQGKREGPDLVAYNPSTKELLIIEIKGVPTTIKMKGKDKGKKKDNKVKRRQFWGWSGLIIIQLIEREYEWAGKSARWVIEVIRKLENAEVSQVRFMGILGHHKKYEEILEKRKHAILRLGYKVLLIDKHGNIKYEIP